VLTMGISFALLYLRFKSRPQNAPRSTRKQQLKLAKLLFGALMAWVAIHYSLQHTIAQIDHADTPPSMLERAIHRLGF